MICSPLSSFPPISFFLFPTRPFSSAYSSIERGSGFTDSVSHNSTASIGSDSLSGSKPGSRLLEAGEVAGDYSMDWKGESRTEEQRINHQCCCCCCSGWTACVPMFIAGLRVGSFAWLLCAVSAVRVRK